MQEIWKSLKGVVKHGNNYEVSNFGRVRSVDRIESYNGKTRKRKGKIIESRFDSHGYPIVLLYLNGMSKFYKIHRLVGLVFLDNPDNLPTINHKDGNKKNNHISNLEWATYGENNKHAYDNGLKHKKLSKEDIEYIQKVYKPYDKEFGSRALSKKFGVSQGRISGVARGVNV